MQLSPWLGSGTVLTLLDGGCLLLSGKNHLTSPGPGEVLPGWHGLRY